MQEAKEVSINGYTINRSHPSRAVSEFIGRQLAKYLSHALHFIAVPLVREVVGLLSSIHQCNLREGYDNIFWSDVPVMCHKMITQLVGL